MKFTVVVSQYLNSESILSSIFLSAIFFGWSTSLLPKTWGTCRKTLFSTSQKRKQLSSCSRSLGECLALQINLNASYAVFRATSKTCLWASSSWYLVYKTFMEMSANFQPTHKSHIWKALLVCNGWEEACYFESIYWRNVYTLINQTGIS